MKKLNKRNQLTTSSVKAFGTSCSCSCSSCSGFWGWLTNNKNGVKDINKLSPNS